MKTLYQYTIKTDGKETIVTELGGKTPLVMLCTDARNRPASAAGLLRDLAFYAIQQAERIEEKEGIKPRPRREFGREYAAQIVEVRG